MDVHEGRVGVGNTDERRGKSACMSGVMHMHPFSYVVLMGSCWSCRVWIIYLFPSNAFVNDAVQSVRGIW